MLRVCVHLRVSLFLALCWCVCRRKSEKPKTFGRTDRHGAHCVFLSCTFLFFDFFFLFLSLRFFFVMAAFAAFFSVCLFILFFLANVRLSMSMIQGKMGMRDKQPSHEPRSFFVYLFIFFFYFFEKKQWIFKGIRISFCVCV